VLLAQGITINGLAILNEEPELDRYYGESVIGGDEAFVVTAADYDDFARALRAKLVREVAGARMAGPARVPGAVLWAQRPGGNPGDLQ
jgi:hypothetical protein